MNQTTYKGPDHPHLHHEMLKKTTLEESSSLKSMQTCFTREKNKQEQIPSQTKVGQQKQQQPETETERQRDSPKRKPNCASQEKAYQKKGNTSPTTSAGTFVPESKKNASPERTTTTAATPTAPPNNPKTILQVMNDLFSTSCRSIDLSAARRSPWQSSHVYCELIVTASPLASERINPHILLRAIARSP